ncbi:MAG: TIGR03087 family PEP-CTERM/XrtA system glycosyltransferase [Candidatus Accumulibacter sp.]|jgi:sugar transferase (PEP-CTERM/EpsH1 system associated)|nr:TIGR03087 family PEP-CTERM/XrtA system glycosyltransferase [Accumulibacter sp.]
MSNLLYLAHRLPYPPNKGDKVRSFHLLRHLAAKHRVFLGTFIDDPADEAHVEKLREFCAETHIARLSPKLARLGSLRGVLNGEALTLPYYRDGRLQTWVNRMIETRRIDAAVVFSSAMAQYLAAFPREKTLVDFCDVDSAKWTQYAPKHPWPLSWIYRREGERLLSHERAIAASAAHSFFVTENEKELFLRSAPECRDKVSAMRNGVDADYFSTRHELASPYAVDEIPLVFTGAMDYWPNIDAVKWFAEEIFPRLETRQHGVRFYIVGRGPTAAVQALAGERVIVTGTVPDVRPYLCHARVIVAPLRVARGVQNKVLEAMAMGLPVVVSKGCGEAIDAVAGRDFLLADGVEDYVRKIGDLLESPTLCKKMGESARRQVLERYSWETNLSAIDRYLSYKP